MDSQDILIDYILQQSKEHILLYLDSAGNHFLIRNKFYSIFSAIPSIKLLDGNPNIIFVYHQTSIKLSSPLLIHFTNKPLYTTNFLGPMVEKNINFWIYALELLDNNTTLLWFLLKLCVWIISWYHEVWFLITFSILYDDLFCWLIYFFILSLIKCNVIKLRY